MLKIPYSLFPAQEAFRNSPATFRGFVGGRGAGKSFIGAVDLLIRAWKTPGLYLVAAPTYPMLMDSSYRSFKKIVNRSPLIRQAKHLHTILNNGSEILWRSADNPDRLRGPNFSGAWFDEASQMDLAAYEVGIATLREEGKLGWLSATFTPRGKQHWTFEVFATGRPDTAIFKARTRDNPFNPPEFHATMQRQYTTAMAAQELEGEFTDLEGAMFRRHWFAVDETAPAPVIKVRFWDLAATEAKEGKDPDWTAGVLMQRSAEGEYHVLDVRRDRLTPAGVERLVRQTAEMDGAETLIYMEQEPGSSGVNTIDHYTRHVLAGFAFWGEKHTGSKSERALPLASMAEHGHVRLLRGPWNKDFLDEIEVFPLGTHDDQADAAAAAFAKISLHAIEPWDTPHDPDNQLSTLRAPDGIFLDHRTAHEDEIHADEDDTDIRWPWD